ncbi:hypothetical protein [Streptomyces sp. NRRL S-448]|uniref:hypothetical protein n=1 Tax=Streptomyces sp. NRRL S-448 TaxID=1463907 RepID=UPI003569D584
MLGKEPTRQCAAHYEIRADEGWYGEALINEEVLGWLEVHDHDLDSSRRQTHHGLPDALVVMTGEYDDSI